MIDAAGSQATVLRVAGSLRDSTIRGMILAVALDPRATAVLRQKGVRVMRYTLAGSFHASPARAHSGQGF